MSLSVLVLAACSGPILEIPETALVRVPRAPVRDIVLQGPDGAIDASGLVGQWTLVSLGWLRCPDVCPTTLRGYADVLETDDVGIWFVGIDPEHDNGRLVDQVRWYDQRILPLTGTRAQLDRVASVMGLAYRPDGEGWEHSTSAAVVDPEANVVGYILQPGNAASVAASLAALRADYRPVADLWVRAGPPTASVLAAFGRVEETIVRVSATGFERAELHASEEVEGLSRMVHRDRVLGGGVLAPGGEHIMLIGPQGRVGSDVLVDLRGTSGPRALLRVPVR